MGGEIAGLGIREGVVGIFHRDEGNYVVFCKFPGILDGGQLVLGPVENQHVIGPVKVLVLPHIGFFQVFHELFVHFHFPFVAYLDFLAFFQLFHFFRAQVVLHQLGHVDPRAPEGHLFKGIPHFRHVFQGQVGPEAGGVVVQGGGVEFFMGIVHHQGQVGHEFFQDQLLPGIRPMAGPVEHQGPVPLVLGNQLLGELGGGMVLLVAPEPVGADGQVGDVPEVLLVEQLAPDAQAVFIDIDVFFH